MMTVNGTGFGQFNVDFNYEDHDRLSVEIKGLGTVAINRTSEGLIVDVHSPSDSESLATICLSDEDFLDGFGDEITEQVRKFHTDAVIEAGFIENSRSSKDSTIHSSEIWLAAKGFDIDLLTPIEGLGKNSLVDISRLCRPYQSITESQHAELFESGHTYFKLPTGVMVTYGESDQGYSLMPVNDEYAEKLLSSAQYRHTSLAKQLTCSKCKNSLKKPDSVVREYESKIGGEPANVTGHYDDDGHFTHDTFDGFGGKEYDLVNDTDNCSNCDQAV